MKSVRVGLVCLSACLMAVGLFAQTEITNGVIQGTVTDPSGAVVRSAGVAITTSPTQFGRKTPRRMEQGRTLDAEDRKNRSTEAIECYHARFQMA